jgi:glycosyltransferase involved in cell wall biosynthesis
MKIVYLMDQMYLHGGAEKIVSLKINALIEDFNHDLFIITTEQKNKKNMYALSSKTNQIDLKINYDRSKSYFHPINLLKTVFHFFKLKKEINKIQPDIVISVSQTPDQFFLPFIRKETPKIKEFHSSGVNLKLGKLKTKLFSLYGKYSVIVVLNKDEKKYYPFSNLEIIPNFILEKINKINKKYEDRSNVIISAGRIAPVKQFDHLIKSWGKLHVKFPNWEVHIYGDGDKDLKIDLEEIIDKNSIKNIFLKGTVANLDDKMNKASIYAMTSSTECFPMVLLEAMSNGVPIVSYDCPNGPRNIITNKEEGILVEVNDINNFSKSLEEMILLENKREIFGNNGFKKSKDFLKDKVMVKWNNLFIKLNTI